MVTDTDYIVLTGWCEKAPHYFRCIIHILICALRCLKSVVFWKLALSQGKTIKRRVKNHVTLCCKGAQFNWYNLCICCSSSLLGKETNFYSYPMVCFSCLYCQQVLALPANTLYFSLSQFLGYFSNINTLVVTLALCVLFIDSFALEICSWRDFYFGILVQNCSQSDDFNLCSSY